MTNFSVSDWLKVWYWVSYTENKFYSMGPVTSHIMNSFESYCSFIPCTINNRPCLFRNRVFTTVREKRFFSCFFYLCCIQKTFQSKKDRTWMTWFSDICLVLTKLQFGPNNSFERFFVIPLKRQFSLMPSLQIEWLIVDFLPYNFNNGIFFPKLLKTEQKLKLNERSFTR